MAKKVSSFNPDVRPVKFNDIIAWLKQRDTNKQIEMLGRRHHGNRVNHFYCSCPDDETIFIYGEEWLHGQNINNYHMKKEEWELICAFMRGIIVSGGDPERASTYADESIPGTKRNFRPNVPAICREYYESKKSSN